MYTRTGQYKKFQKAEVVLKDKLIISKVQNKSVLDVGCIGQDRDFTNEKWLHNILRKHSSSVVGVDIIQERIDELRSKGFNIVHYNELEKLNQKFDVILMGDVIEHVDNPVGFIANYSAYLNDKGIMVITTPNAKRAFDFVNILISGKYWHNEEHTFWLCPKTMIEVAERAKMDISEFYWLAPYRFGEGKTSFKVWVIRLISNILMKLRKNFNENFMVVLKKKA